MIPFSIQGFKMLAVLCDASTDPCAESRAFSIVFGSSEVNRRIIFDSVNVLDTLFSILIYFLVMGVVSNKNLHEHPISSGSCYESPIRSPTSAASTLVLAHDRLDRERRRLGNEHLPAISRGPAAVGRGIWLVPAGSRHGFWHCNRVRGAQQRRLGCRVR